jgi:hypothetical protein
VPTLTLDDACKFCARKLSHASHHSIKALTD